MMAITSGWWIIASVCVTETYFNWVDRRARIICNRPFYNDIRCQTTCIGDNSTVGLFSTSIRRWAISAGGQYCRITTSLIAFQCWNVKVQQKINAVLIGISSKAIIALVKMLDHWIHRFALTRALCWAMQYWNEASYRKKFQFIYSHIFAYLLVTI